MCKKQQKMAYIIKRRIERQLKKKHVAVIIQALIREQNGLLFWSNYHSVNCKSWWWGKSWSREQSQVDSTGSLFNINIGWRMVGHIPREILQHVYFFIKQEGRRVYGKLKQNPLRLLQEVLRSHCYSSLNPKTNVSRTQWKNFRKVSILSILQGI